MKLRKEGYLPGERLEVTIERIVPGGSGLARGPKGVILVEQSAPGDILEIEIESRRAGAARGRIRAIRQASESRVEPPCVYYGRCGGCDFQHLRYDAQLDAKEAMLRDALRRIGGIDWTGPIERFAAPEPFGSRARMELHTDSETGALGFFSRHSHHVVAVDHCIVCRPELDAALQTMRASDSERPAAVHLIAADGLAYSSPAVSPLPTGKFWLEVDGFEYFVDPAAFFQSSYDLLPVLIERVLSSGEDPRRLAWDLFSGVGLFSLPLARQFDEVAGVEVDRHAVDNAARGAVRNGIHNARFFADDVEHWASARRRRSEFPDLVVVDPPRSGLGPKLSARLAEIRPRYLTYVACDPSALARDLEVLTADSLRLRDIAIFDLFPQTHHVETVARLATEYTR